MSYPNYPSQAQNDTRYSRITTQVAALGNLGPSITLSDPKTYGMQVGILSSNTVITLPTAVAGISFDLWLVQDSIGSKTPSFSTTPAISQPSGAPVWRLGAGEVNRLVATCRDASSWEIVPVTSGVTNATETYLTLVGTTGASVQYSFVGANAGIPTSGTFSLNDVVLDTSIGAFRICTAAGSPGTWSSVSGASLPVVAWSANTSVLPNKFYQLPTGGMGYVNASMTTAATWAADRSSWTFLPGGHYEKISASGSWTVPVGIVTLRVKAIGGGGSGGSGGSAAQTSGVSNQTGGGGGGAGLVIEQLISVVGNGTATITIGTGGTAGTSGAASTGSTGNAASAGSNGGSTILTVNGTTLTASGGGYGAASGANSSTTSAGGIYGTPSRSSIYIAPGFGGASNGQAGGMMDNVAGGGAGASATASLGGGGGLAYVTKGTPPNPGSSGSSSTTMGVNGTSATIPGSGGGGGGGGAPGGAGGTGGSGASGLVELFY